eukprot:CAMPEP_0167776610 /NCGR_PEP_ID=MMETSP0111_2-20121227/3222_1 /TAXON_ID=91324 /ORGANISM="Lotharella globosa, Strain CCCM811" /LENGTH=181 /DNA_ID=CAMNT_0007666679 /DNA_START=61 /DNA_END=603 /DNA_ORIENTATION=-
MLVLASGKEEEGKQKDHNPFEFRQCGISLTAGKEDECIVLRTNLCSGMTTLNYTKAGTPRIEKAFDLKKTMKNGTSGAPSEGHKSICSREKVGKSSSPCKVCFDVNNLHFRPAQPEVSGLLRIFRSCSASADDPSSPLVSPLSVPRLLESQEHEDEKNFTIHLGEREDFQTRCGSNEDLCS